MGAFSVGADVRVGRAARAQTMWQKSSFVAADSELLPFAVSAFNVALSHGALTYADVPASAKEIRRVLAERGNLVLLCELNGLNPWVRVNSGFGSRQTFSLFGYARTLARSGLQISDVRTIDFFPTRLRRLLSPRSVYSRLVSLFEQALLGLPIVSLLGGVVFISAVSAPSLATAHRAECPGKGGPNHTRQSEGCLGKLEEWNQNDISEFGSRP